MAMLVPQCDPSEIEKLELLHPEFIESLKQGKIPPLPGADRRKYQMDGVEACREKFLEGKKSGQLIVGTGGGKTMMGLMLAAQTAGRTLWLAPGNTPIERAKDEAEKFAQGRTIQIVNSVEDLMVEADIYYATTQMLMANDKFKQIPKDRFAKLIADEAHDAMGVKTREIFDHFSGYHLHMTATPETMVKHLDRYAELFFEYSSDDLIKNDGYPVWILKEHEVTDETIYDAKVIGDNYAIAEGEETQILNMPHRYAICLKILREAVKKKEKAKVFFPSVYSSKYFVNEIAAKDPILAGHVAHIDGTMSKKEVNDLYNNYNSTNGNILVVCGNSKWEQSLDVKSIKHVVLADPSRSKRVIMQRIGRGARPYPGKDFLYVHDVVSAVRNMDGTQSANMPLTVSAAIGLKRTGKNMALNGQHKGDILYEDSTGKQKKHRYIEATDVITREVPFFERQIDLSFIANNEHALAVYKKFASIFGVYFSNLVFRSEQYLHREETLTLTFPNGSTKDVTFKDIYDAVKVFGVQDLLELAAQNDIEEVVAGTSRSARKVLKESQQASNNISIKEALAKEPHGLLDPERIKFAPVIKGSLMEKLVQHMFADLKSVTEQKKAAASKSFTINVASVIAKYSPQTPKLEYSNIINQLTTTLDLIGLEVECLDVDSKPTITVSIERLQAIEEKFTRSADRLKKGKSYKKVTIELERGGKPLEESLKLVDERDFLIDLHLRLVEAKDNGQAYMEIPLNEFAVKYHPAIFEFIVRLSGQYEHDFVWPLQPRKLDDTVYVPIDHIKLEFLSATEKPKATSSSKIKAPIPAEEGPEIKPTQEQIWAAFNDHDLPLFSEERLKYALVKQGSIEDFAIRKIFSIVNQNGEMDVDFKDLLPPNTELNDSRLMKFQRSIERIISALGITHNKFKGRISISKEQIENAQKKHSDKSPKKDRLMGFNGNGVHSQATTANLALGYDEFYKKVYQAKMKNQDVITFSVEDYEKKFFECLNSLQRWGRLATKNRARKIGKTVYVDISNIRVIQAESKSIFDLNAREPHIPAVPGTPEYELVKAVIAKIQGGDNGLSVTDYFEKTDHKLPQSKIAEIAKAAVVILKLMGFYSANFEPIYNNGLTKPTPVILVESKRTEEENWQLRDHSDECHSIKLALTSTDKKDGKNFADVPYGPYEKVFATNPFLQKIYGQLCDYVGLDFFHIDLADWTPQNIIAMQAFFELINGGDGQGVNGGARPEKFRFVARRYTDPETKMTTITIPVHHIALSFKPILPEAKRETNDIWDPKRLDTAPVDPTSPVRALLEEFFKAGRKASAEKNNKDSFRFNLEGIIDRIIYSWQTEKLPHSDEYKKDLAAKAFLILKLMGFKNITSSVFEKTLQRLDYWDIKSLYEEELGWKHQVQQDVTKNMAEEAVAVKGDSNTTVFIPAHQKERFLSSPFLKQFGVDLINAIIQKAPTIKIWLTDWSKAADDDIEFIYNFLSENGYHDIRIRRQGNKIVLPVDQFKEVTNLSPEMIQTSTQSAVNKVISGSR